MADAIVAKNWRDLIKPRGLEVDQESLTDTYGKFVGRAARARLRHHARQLAAPRAALVACRARPSPR